MCRDDGRYARSFEEGRLCHGRREPQFSRLHGYLPDDPKFPGMPKNDLERRFMAMPAYIGGKYQMAGCKWYGSNIENKKKGLPRSILMFILSDKDTGAPVAIMSANLLSSYRTGAIPGVGSKNLARKDSETVAIFGPGVMGRTSLAAFVATNPKLHKLKIKGRGQKSIDSFIAYVKKEYPQFDEITVCETEEEAVRDSDIISFTTVVTSSDDYSCYETYPHIKGEWVKKGAFISMPSAALFDDDFLINKAKLVVDNSGLYEAWAAEYPYPTYPKMGIIGCEFMDLIHDKKIARDDMVDIADIVTGVKPGRQSEDDIYVYSVGGMPVEDVAWGTMVYRNAVKLGIGTKLNLWDTPEMA